METKKKNKAGQGRKPEPIKKTILRMAVHIEIFQMYKLYKNEIKALLSAYYRFKQEGEGAFRFQYEEIKPTKLRVFGE